jgi:hypothetical protein
MAAPRSHTYRAAVINKETRQRSDAIHSRWAVCRQWKKSRARQARACAFKASENPKPNGVSKATLQFTPLEWLYFPFPCQQS